MLRLPFPIVCIDTVKPMSALVTLRETLLLTKPTSVTLLTDLKKHANTTVVQTASLLGVTAIHHVQSDAQHRFNGIKRVFFKDYEIAHMTELPKYMGNSSHVLYMEWDSGVLNPMAWDAWFLQWDYIGAPWPPHTNSGWPPCDGETNAVGNSGFSLRSRKFCDLVAEAVSNSDDEHRYGSDMWMCRTIRPWLEERGIKFAPVEVAQKFSCENRIYAGQFGFHGRSTAKMNNWGGWMDQFRDKSGRQ